MVRDSSKECLGCNLDAQTLDSIKKWEQLSCRADTGLLKTASKLSQVAGELPDTRREKGLPSRVRRGAI
jgi:hypothetical protein